MNLNFALCSRYKILEQYSCNNYGKNERYDRNTFMKYIVWFLHSHFCVEISWGTNSLLSLPVLQPDCQNQRKEITQRGIL